MKTIVLVNQSLNYLTADIANEFAKKYERTILVYGYMFPSSNKLNPSIASIELKKIIAYNKKNLIYRLFTWIVGTVQIYIQLLKLKKHEILFFTNPPLSYLLSSFFQNLNFSIVVFDIYPDALKNFGFKENNYMYKWWQNRNRKVFSKSKVIFTIGNEMKSTLMQYVSEEKISVIPLWGDMLHLKPIAKSENKFTAKYMLEDKFIVMYSGNIGFTHNVEVIIELAKELSGYPDIVFLIIGDGGKKKILQKQVNEYQIKNCIFLDWQVLDMMPYSLACGDIGIVTINEKTSALSIPSKTFNLMATGTPILSIAPRNSELNLLIERYNNGVCYDKNQLKEMQDFIIKIKTNPDYKEKMRQNSLSAANNYTPENARLFYLHLTSNNN